MSDKYQQGYRDGRVYGDVMITEIAAGVPCDPTWSTVRAVARRRSSKMTLHDAVKYQRGFRDGYRASWPANGWGEYRVEG